MNDTAVLLLVILVAVVLSMIVAAVIVRRSQSRAAAAISGVGPARRTIAATALGVSGDEVELRGTGTLALTDDELAFAQWRPEHLLRIPRSAITQVDTTREHLGKTMKTDVLRVTWRSPGRGGGAERSVAFFIRDLTPWLTELDPG